MQMPSALAAVALALALIFAPPVAAAAGAGFEDAFPQKILPLGPVGLAYRIGGHGPPVVLIHGWPSTGDSWRLVAPRLAAARTVIVVDMRGLGASTGPDKGYDKLSVAEDVHALVKALGYQSIDLVGHDLGGQVAYAYAMEHPSEVRTLAILEIALPGLVGWDQLHPWHFGFNSIPDMPEALTAGREATFMGVFWRGRAFPPEMLALHVRAYQRPGAMHAGFEYYRAFPQDERRNKAWLAEGRRLAMPVLWLAAGQGVFTPVLPQQLALVADDLRGHPMPGCGHWMPLECPAETADALLDFWATQARPAPR